MIFFEYFLEITPRELQQWSATASSVRAASGPPPVRQSAGGTAPDIER
jgi:hypothetical protein